MRPHNNTHYNVIIYHWGKKNVIKILNFSWESVGNEFKDVMAFRFNFLSMWFVKKFNLGCSKFPTVAQQTQQHVHRCDNYCSMDIRYTCWQVIKTWSSLHEFVIWKHKNSFITKCIHQPCQYNTLMAVDIDWTSSNKELVMVRPRSIHVYITAILKLLNCFNPKCFIKGFVTVAIFINHHPLYNT